MEIGAVVCAARDGVYRGVKHCTQGLHYFPISVSVHTSSKEWSHCDITPLKNTIFTAVA